jgi:hypothetical protein
LFPSNCRLVVYCSTSSSFPSSGHYVRDGADLTFSPHIAFLVHFALMVQYGHVCSSRYSSDWGASIVTGDILEDLHSRRGLASSNCSSIRLRTEWSCNFCMSGEEHHNGQQETPRGCLEDVIAPPPLLLTSLTSLVYSKKEEDPLETMFRMS